VASGGLSFKSGHLVQLTGFTNANNSGIFRVASSTATTIILAGASPLTDEAAPPLGAIIRVVGVEGASGDITATALGLSSTALNFTTLGLTLHQWVKIGATATIGRFANAANNGFARITSISANALTFDNLPEGWAIDAGAGKTIRAWFGDYIRNGVTMISHTYEKAFTSQASPKYYQFTGQVVDSLNIELGTGGISKINATLLGQTEITSDTSLNTNPAPAFVEDGFNAINDVNRMMEGNSNILNNNPAKQFSINLANNLRERPAIGFFGSINLGLGSCDVTGSINTYFENDTLLAKYKNQTKTAIGTIFKKAGKAVVIYLPTVTITSADKVTTGRNTDVEAKLSYVAQKNNNQLYSVQIDMFHYLED
jgi:hypothetical protein